MEDGWTATYASSSPGQKYGMRFLSHTPRSFCAIKGKAGWRCNVPSPTFRAATTPGTFPVPLSVQEHSVGGGRGEVAHGGEVRRQWCPLSYCGLILFPASLKRGGRKKPWSLDACGKWERDFPQWEEKLKEVLGTALIISTAWKPSACGEEKKLLRIGDPIPFPDISLCRGPAISEPQRGRILHDVC